MGPWLHADGQVADEGICYAARYIGCLEVKESMKALTYDASSLIANECIARVCEAAGLKSADRMPRLDKKMARSLGDGPIMDQAGSIVRLTITSSRLTLTTLEEGQVIASHEMPNISFVWWGPDMIDFVGYVAEDSRYGRVCSVLECGGVAQNVVLTIGQAFEVGFKEHLKRTPSYAKSCIELPAPAPPASDDPEYYNELPGKVPPDAPTEPGPPSRPAPAAPAAPGAALYANDMQPFGACLPAGGTGGGATAATPPPVPPRRSPAPPSFTPLARQAENQQQLEKEPWYHGPISRRRAETLLLRDGDFLVRKSHGAPGEFVLTGLQKGVCRHFLLVDPEGVARTKNLAFKSVVELIDYHRKVPILSAKGHALTLSNPVLRR